MKAFLEKEAAKGRSAVLLRFFLSDAQNQAEALKAAMKAQTVSENFLQERRWEERGVRYGELEEIGMVENMFDAIEKGIDPDALIQEIEKKTQMRRMENN